jgi:hypothetical protein
MVPKKKIWKDKKFALLRQNLGQSSEKGRLSRDLTVSRTTENGRKFARAGVPSQEFRVAGCEFLRAQILRWMTSGSIRFFSRFGGRLVGRNSGFETRDSKFDNHAKR